VQLLTCETPDFIAPALWPANSPDLNVVRYQTWGKHRSRMHDVDQLRSRLIEEWEHFHQVFSEQSVASTSSSLHPSTRRTFWTQTSVMFDICTYVHFDSICLFFCLWWTLLFWGDLTIPAITIASVEGFYLNLVICLLLDIALLVQNYFIKIW